MMFKKTILSLCCTLWVYLLAAQLNMSLVGELDYASDLSDIWGYVDAEGNEYAIVGVNNGGVSIVEVTDPANPHEVFFSPGPSTIWRDIKTWDNHAYITNEASGGLKIIDLSTLPADSNLTVTTYTDGDWESAHNLYIDENGVCYIFGANRGNGGVILLDLTQDPKNPVELGEWDVLYVHDGMARGDTLYACNVYDGVFNILDVSDKAAPTVLASSTTPSNVTHNAWVSDDGNYLYTTDEITNGFIGSYDISDLGNVKEIDRVQSNPGSGVIPHNAHFLDEYLVTSYYRDGVTVHDVARPHNVIEVGNYDTSPLSGNGFNGSWGAYPWLPSGIVLASDIESGLMVFDVDYQRGCYLEGTITESGSGTPLGNAEIMIVSTDLSESSDLAGEYATGTAIAGDYDVIVSKAGYISDTTMLTLSNGVLTVHDVELVPLTSFAITGQVIEANTGNPIQGASVLLQNELFSFEQSTNSSGNFEIAEAFEGEYEIVSGKWSYQTVCSTSVYFSESSNTITIELDSGYYDDFSFDFGWSSEGEASSGLWERDEPEGTFLGPFPSNPDLDVSTDCLDQAFVTGNDGGDAGDDDVDNANADLTSPVFDLSTYQDPYLNYSRWFFNAGGGVDPNDSLVVSLNNGDTIVAVEVVTADDAQLSQWVDRTIRIADHLAPTDNMQLIVHTADWEAQGGNIVEAGFDQFSIEDSIPSVGIEEQSTRMFSIYPNPTNGNLTIVSRVNDLERLQVYDYSGRLHDEQQITRAHMGGYVYELSGPSGIYLLRCIQSDGTASMVQVIKF